MSCRPSEAVMANLLLVALWLRRSRVIGKTSRRVAEWSQPTKSVQQFEWLGQRVVCRLRGIVRSERIVWSQVV